MSKESMREITIEIDKLAKIMSVWTNFEADEYECDFIGNKLIMRLFKNEKRFKASRCTKPLTTNLLTR